MFLSADTDDPVINEAEDVILRNISESESDCDIETGMSFTDCLWSDGSDIDHGHSVTTQRKSSTSAANSFR